MSGVISAPWAEFFQGLVARAADPNEARRSRAGIDPMDAANEPDPLTTENAQLRDLIDAQEAQIMALRQSLDIALARIAKMVDPPPTLKMADPIHRALTVGTVNRDRP